MIKYWSRSTVTVPDDLTKIGGSEVSPLDFHRQVPGYGPTDLISLPDLAELAGVGEVALKYEKNRFGLPSFKPLGALWGVYRWVHQQVGVSPPREAVPLESLRALARNLGDVTFMTATDGNHGRGVAFAARLVGFGAYVVVPRGTAASRIDAIRGEGAEVYVMDGDYDAAVAHVASMADERHVIVSDTSWPGYRDIPGWIADGYSTIFSEIDVASDHRLPDVVLVPVGVGALAQAAIDYYAARNAEVRVVSVEPDDAACVLMSLVNNARTSAPGPHRSMMVGLNCGSPSLVAWPTMRDGFAAAVSIADSYAVAAMRWLADHGIEVGETGAATTGALLAQAAGEFPQLAHDLGLTPESRVLLVATESCTDAVNYRRIVGGASEGS